MPETKVGLSQFSRPSPLWYRRLTNAIILCFLPMYTGIVQGVSMDVDVRNINMIIIASIPFLLKGIGMILGNGQDYTPSNETIDKLTQIEKENGK